MSDLVADISKALCVKGVELPELVSMLIRNRDRCVRNITSADAENLRLRKTIESLEARIEDLTERPSAFPVARVVAAPVPPAGAAPSQMKAIEAEPVDEDLWDQMFGGWVA